MSWADAFLVVGAVTIFFAALLAIVWCIAIAAIRQRFTLKLLLVMLTAVCVLAGFLSMGREAARRQSIKTIEMQRAFYLEHRSEFNPQQYDQLMQELDADAARLGLDK
ncbi:MAG: hypothetical protein JNL18_04960 [Planctomycetaceae bacterium]|nr:hypothetical protein [Planctomycetaceae bacterium]